MYTKDLAKASCVVCTFMRYEIFVLSVLFKSYPSGLYLNCFSIAQTIILTGMCSPTGLFNFLAFNFRLIGPPVLRQEEGVGKRALLYCTLGARQCNRPRTAERVAY
jgi:hypothetical protein